MEEFKLRSRISGFSSSFRGSVDPSISNGGGTGYTGATGPSGGERGPVGPEGPTGENGKDGKDGKDGEDGENFLRTGIISTNINPDSIILNTGLVVNTDLDLIVNDYVIVNHSTDYFIGIISTVNGNQITIVPNFISLLTGSTDVWINSSIGITGRNYRRFYNVLQEIDIQDDVLLLIQNGGGILTIKTDIIGSILVNERVQISNKDNLDEWFQGIVQSITENDINVYIETVNYDDENEVWYNPIIAIIASGPKGDNGNDGISMTGEVGPTGEKGDSMTGEVGPTGEKGDSITGEVGPTGEKGDSMTGEVGPAGSFTPVGTIQGQFIYWDSELSEWSINSDNNNICLGNHAGGESQFGNSIAIGYYAGMSLQETNSIAIGYETGMSQMTKSVAIGNQAGVSQGQYSIAMGNRSGNSGQGDYSVAMGNRSGDSGQGDYSVAIGHEVGYTGQGFDSVAMGTRSGKYGQGNHSVAIGTSAGETNQGSDTIAIGYQAGFTGQGTYSIAIGNQAGKSNQTQNSIIINADSSSLDNDKQGLFINPVREEVPTSEYQTLCYNITSKEIIRSTQFVGQPTNPTPEDIDVDERHCLVYKYDGTLKTWSWIFEKVQS